MAYSVDMPSAARRHLQAAQKLHELQHGHELVAAYLFGIAAECALKALAHGFDELRSLDVLHAHFPDLRYLMLDRLQGRRASGIRTLLEREDFMSGWAIKVRYARRDELPIHRFATWAEQAAHAVNIMSAEL